MPIEKSLKFGNAESKLTENEVTDIIADVTRLLEEAKATERSRIAAWMAKEALDRVHYDPQGADALIYASKRVMHNDMPDDGIDPDIVIKAIQ